MNSLGIALRAVRRFEEAIDASIQAAEIFREVGDVLCAFSELGVDQAAGRSLGERADLVAASAGTVVTLAVVPQIV